MLGLFQRGAFRGLMSYGTDGLAPDPRGNSVEKERGENADSANPDEGRRGESDDCEHPLFP